MLGTHSVLNCLLIQCSVIYIAITLVTFTGYLDTCMYSIYSACKSVMCVAEHSYLKSRYKYIYIYISKILCTCSHSIG